MKISKWILCGVLGIMMLMVQGCASQMESVASAPSPVDRIRIERLVLNSISKASVLDGVPGAALVSQSEGWLSFQDASVLNLDSFLPSEAQVLVKREGVILGQDAVSAYVSGGVVPGMEVVSVVSGYYNQKARVLYGTQDRPFSLRGVENGRAVFNGNVIEDRRVCVNDVCGIQRVRVSFYDVELPLDESRTLADAEFGDNGRIEYVFQFLNDRTVCTISKVKGRVVFAVNGVAY